MNVVLWLIAGGLMGLLAFAALKLNSGAGPLVSITIGVVTAFLGGQLLAPILGASAGEASELSPFALVVAAATALGCLAIADLTSKRLRA